MRLTIWVAEEDEKNRIQGPVGDGGEVKGHEGDQQGKRPDLTEHGCEGELVPEFPQVRERKHADD